MTKKKKFAIAGGVVAALLVIGGTHNSPTPAAPAAAETTSSPTPTVDVPEATPTETPSETPSPEPSLAESKFGETADFADANNTAFTIKVTKAKRAKCKYSGIGCDKPETGDHFVTVPITIKNGGSDTIEMSAEMFVVEFADGTRMTSLDGSTYQYAPDNTMDYGVKIRPGATLKTSLTFEAPAGAYSVVLLDSQYEGNDLHIWK